MAHRDLHEFAVRQRQRGIRDRPTAKAHELLGWARKVSLADGMARTEAWLRADGHLGDPDD